MEYRGATLGELKAVTDQYTVCRYPERTIEELATLRAQLAKANEENARLRYYLRAIAESDDIRFVWPREMAREAMK